MVEIITPADAWRLMLAAGYGKTALKCPAVHFTARRKMRWKRASLHDQMHEQMPSLLGVKD
jgi:hypothetical protein